jgi:Uma2 family endonuclease
VRLTGRIERKDWGYDRPVSEAIAPLTFEDFCAQEATSDRRHEFVGGRVYAMAGGSERHDLAAGLCFEALAPAARAAGCRPFTANRLVRTASNAGYYPDVLVACGRAAHRLYEEDAVVVIEVLSPSTTDIDRREKAHAYAGLPSFEQLLLVDPDRRRVEVATLAQGGLRWEAYGAADVVTTRFGVLDVDALYDELDRVASTD